MNHITSQTVELPTSVIVFREDIYPRMRVLTAEVEEYALAIDRLPPIEVNQDNVIIDGVIRFFAHKAMKRETIPVIITHTKSDDDIWFLAFARNARQGLRLSAAEIARAGA